MLVKAKLFSVCRTAWNKLTTYHYIKEVYITCCRQQVEEMFLNELANAMYVLEKIPVYHILFTNCRYWNLSIDKYKLILSGGILSVSM